MTEGKMEQKDSASALMLLQYGGDDSDEDTSLNESTGKSPKRRSSYKPGGPLSPSRRISEDSVGKHVAALISDEEGEHHDLDSSTGSKKRLHEDNNAEEEVVPPKMTMADVSKKMAPSVSPFLNNDSRSSFADSQHSSKSQKKSSKPAPPVLVSYYGDDQDDDEDRSSDESQNADSDDQNDQGNGQEDNYNSPGARGLVRSDGSIQLPPEPTGKCSKDLQDKITDLYTRMRQQGFDTNNEIQRLTSFRNPSIYEKLIQMHHIDEKGSNFPLDVYNPHMWGKDSMYDELDKAQKKDMERREKDRKTKIEFISGTKKSAPMSDSSGSLDDKKRKSKWDALPQGLPPGQRGSSGSAPNLTSSATGTRATVISAVGTLTKKSSFSIIGQSGPAK